jgi:bifunctional DNA-binding transcriptional regulator/antitoxin component of YhaV-PrlF toxin-antitoxin module
VSEIKTRRRGAKISAKHQVTIPMDAMRSAGLTAGQRVVARAEGPGRVVLEREEDVLALFSGALTGVFDPDGLAKLRDEWD